MLDTSRRRWPRDDRAARARVASPSLAARLLARHRRRGNGHEQAGYWLHLSNIDASTWRATFSRDAMISAGSLRRGSEAVGSGATGDAGGVGEMNTGEAVRVVIRAVLVPLALGLMLASR